MKKQEGFTLIELIIVIIILGVLAAYAVPKYMSLDEEARKTVVKGLEGSIRSSSEMVHAIAITRGVGSGNVNITDSETITVASYYPTASNTGIVATLSDVSGFNISVADGIVTFQKTGATNPAQCAVTYTLRANDSKPTIKTVSEFDCK
jgi:MSHA pilin protein MshA